ncbi:MAG: ATP-dependent helicase HrpB [Porticoccaceae bacterium]|nr:ATP-dependent helicase HrpB [Porticoccaceae bacterium]
MSNDPVNLPIDAVLPDVCSSLSVGNRCLLVAQPGAGKTTRVPLSLLNLNPSGGRWLLLEPRRVAARLAATYMAAQLGEAVGKTVGYRVRGEQKVGSGTRLEVVTQGILIRMLQDDPALEGVDGLIFDEFHERGLDSDLGLALALDVQSGLRDDLKLLVMSATLDVESLLGLLGRETPVIECPGRTWPVDTVYRPPQSREAPAAHQARVIAEALGEVGDILVFLPGQREIRRLATTLQKVVADDVAILALHGQMPLAAQQTVLQPSGDGKRRVILSTAVAESSLTVPGVRIVVDAGQERVPVYQSRSGLTRLDTRRVNRASADQRRGRAGREAAGICYRLWSQEQVLVPHGEPEILQADLAGLVYELALWGVTDAGQLDWVTPPPEAALASARALLAQLGMVNADGRLTNLGHGCRRWPAHPRIAVMLEAARRQRLLPLACWLVSWLEENPAFDDPDLQQHLERRPTGDGGGDGGRWFRAARQWAQRTGVSLSVDDFSGAAGLLARAYPDRIAENRGAGRFRLATGGQALLPESHSLARSPFLVIPALDGQASGARIYSAISITQGDIETALPEAPQWQRSVYWDEDAGRLVGEERRCHGAVILSRRTIKELPAAAVRSALIEAVRRRGQLSWSESDRQLLGRLRLVRRVLGDPWPDVSDAALLATLEDWLTPYLQAVTRLADLDRLPLGRYLLDSLDWQLRQQLDSLVPRQLTVPSGAQVSIDYSGEEPILAVKLQEMFGQTNTPRLVGGRVPVLIHLLSPARRPVQVTRDLANFWATTYFDVRRELKGRYPKHPWPDDPLTAIATGRTKKRAGN